MMDADKGNFSNESFEETTKRNSKFVMEQRQSRKSRTMFDLPEGSDLQGMIDEDEEGDISFCSDDEAMDIVTISSKERVGKGLFLCFWALAIFGITACLFYRGEKEEEMARTIKNGTPILPQPPVNLESVCAPMNLLKADDAYNECLHMCEPAKCCELSNGNGNSCFEANHDVCLKYRSSCQHLDSVKASQAKKGDVTVAEACNVETLVSKAAVDACKGICADYQCCFEEDADKLPSSTCGFTSAVCQDYGACQTLVFVEEEGFKDTAESIFTVEVACEDAGATDKHELCQNVCSPGRCCFLPSDFFDGECTRDCDVYEACSVIYGSQESSATKAPKAQATTPAPTETSSETDTTTMEEKTDDPNELVLDVEVSCEWSTLQLDSGKSCRKYCKELVCCANGGCEGDQSQCSAYEKCYTTFAGDFPKPSSGTPTPTDSSSSTTLDNSNGLGNFSAVFPDVDCAFVNLELDEGEKCHESCNKISCCGDDSCPVDSNVECSLFAYCTKAFPDEYFLKGKQPVLDSTAEPCTENATAADDGKACRAACNQYSCCHYGNCFNDDVCSEYDICIERFPKEYSYHEEDFLRVWEAAFIALLAGSVGAAVGIAVAYPLDTIKTRAQVIGTRGNNMSMTTIVKQLWEKEGIRGFYGGLRPTVVGEARIKAVAFSWNAGALYFFENYLTIVSPTAAIWIAALLSGFGTSFVVSPVERIKVMMQTSWEYKNEFDCIKAIVRNDGWLGLMFRGLVPTMLREVPRFGMYFGFYGLLMESYAAKVLGEAPSSLIFGAVAGMLSTIPVFPIDKVKTLVQNTDGGEETAKAWVEVTRAIYREHGLLSFWDGLVPVLFREAIYNAVLFLVFDALFRYLNDLFGFDGTVIP